MTPKLSSFISRNRVFTALYCFSVTLTFIVTFTELAQSHSPVLFAVSSEMITMTFAARMPIAHLVGVSPASSITSLMVKSTCS